jgi:transcriptional antiterminator RfaH
MSWYCIQTHQKKEFLAASQIINQGFTVFLPTFVSETVRRGEKQARIQPLFSSYLFVEFDPDQDIWFPLMHTIGVKKLFSTGITKDKNFGYIKPTAVPTDFITSLQQQVSAPPAQPAVAMIVPGARLRVTSGIFENKTGICSWSTTKRVALLMEVMNGTVEFTFTRDLVELLAEHNKS